MSQIDSQTQVLLVDDDPYLRKALSQTLDLAGLRVLGLDDARGLAARLPADWPGVVVSDIRMPGLDGLQLLQQLQDHDAELPVLLITGHGDIQLAVQAMRAGAYDFLEKPFPSEALLDSVRRALALRQLVL
ncbi:MAG TPA: Fis family transcriptional regulator, partial [Pseudomonas sp.]|nr:Fis family transcriptional regulator [Pseudomonas sp.]